MKTTMIINIFVLACLLVGAAAGAADPTAAAGAHRRALLTTRRLRGAGGRRQLWGEKFWKKMPSTGAPGIGESVKATYSAYCDRFVAKSEEAAKPLSAKVKAINDQAATPKPLSAIVNLRTQALGVFNDPQLHWIRFDAPMQSGCGATGCMCKPGSHSQEFDDVVIGVRDEVVASLAAQPLVCPVVQEAIKRVEAGTGSDFCPGIHTSGAGVMSSYKAKAAQACGSLGLAANDPLLTGGLQYEWLGRNKAGLDKHTGFMTTGKTCAEQVADSLLIACADAVEDRNRPTFERGWAAYISARAVSCGGGRKQCPCIEKTCTPTKGDSKGKAVHYPATGVLDGSGSAEWCFVGDDCDTTQVGNGHSCDGAKFAFLDGRIPSWSKDTSPTFAVPHKEPEKLAATFFASGCPVPRTIGWWKSGISEARVFQDMFDYCELTRTGRANAVQRDVCCGAGKSCTPICTKQTRYTMTVDAARRNKRRKQCPCVAKTCTPTKGANKGRSMHYPATGVNGEWCFVADDCETTQVGNGHSCAGAKFAFLDGRIPSWSKDTAPTYGVRQ